MSLLELVHPRLTCLDMNSLWDVKHRLVRGQNVIRNVTFYIRLTQSAHLEFRFS